MNLSNYFFRDSSLTLTWQIINIFYEMKLSLSDKCTVLRITKLNTFPVQVRLRSGSGKLKLCRYFTMFCDI